MLAVEKKAFTALRRRRCMSWSIVATIEFGAIGKEDGSTVFRFRC